VILFFGFIRALQGRPVPASTRRPPVRGQRFFALIMAIWENRGRLEMSRWLGLQDRALGGLPCPQREAG
jgi:hypothetical protein